jgi:hypothetical protein
MAFRRTVFSILALLGIYVALLAFPYPMFSYAASYRNITVYSDRPIPAAINPVLHTVENRLDKSPLNDPSLRHRVFICNSNRLFALFANSDYRVGGKNYVWLSRNIFLRQAHIDHDRLVGPSGNEVPGERTLAYFVAHEITHSLEVNYLGRSAYFKLPAWKREGYADLVAKDGDFDFPQKLAAFQRGDREMDPARSGLYLRYQLLVTYVMDKKQVSAQTLLAQPFDQEALERELHAIGAESMGGNR